MKILIENWKSSHFSRLNVIISKLCKKIHSKSSFRWKNHFSVRKRKLWKIEIFLYFSHLRSKFGIFKKKIFAQKSVFQKMTFPSNFEKLKIFFLSHLSKFGNIAKNIFPLKDRYFVQKNHFWERKWELWKIEIFLIFTSEGHARIRNIPKNNFFTQKCYFVLKNTFGQENENDEIWNFFRVSPLNVKIWKFSKKNSSILKIRYFVAKITFEQKVKILKNWESSRFFTFPKFGNIKKIFFHSIVVFSVKSWARKFFTSESRNFRNFQVVIFQNFLVKKWLLSRRMRGFCHSFTSEGQNLEVFTKFFSHSTIVITRTTEGRPS